MSTIQGIEGLTMPEIYQEVSHGGRFVVFQYTISVIFITFRRSSNIIFVKSDEKQAVKGLPYTLLSLFLGWWGFPWGPIYTIQTLVKNMRGGKDLTSEVLVAMQPGENGNEGVKQVQSW